MSLIKSHREASTRTAPVSLMNSPREASNPYKVTTRTPSRSLVKSPTRHGRNASAPHKTRSSLHETLLGSPSHNL